MRLRTKFFLSIGTIISIAFAITFYRTYIFQNQLIYEQAEHQARLLAEQILLTRKWVADHNGIFMAKQPGMDLNPFLTDSVVRDDKGNIYLKSNPAMVTRELSLYASEANFCRFRVTSLNPINPANAPDDFERVSLASFKKGISEAVSIEPTKGGRVLRYIKPLVTQNACMECHDQHGYKIGDQRGGLSLSIPIGWADERAAKNFKLLSMIGLLTVICVGFAVYLLINRLIVKRIDIFTHFFQTFPREIENMEELVQGNDEITELGKNVIKLRNRLLSSQRKLNEAHKGMFQAEKLAALGRLSAGVAHEINNPLGGMRNCIKSLKENPTDQALSQRYLPLIDDGLQRIEIIVKQLLNFGKKEPLRYRMGSIDDLIQESLLLLEYRLKNIDLDLNLGLKKPSSIDVEALKQVIMNIIMNALQAMGDSGRLLIQTYQEDQGVRLVFTDTGPGIPQETIDKIFDPFYTTKKEGEGTGLGLSVSYSLVKNMGGTILVTSSEGSGTTFTVTLPFKD